MTQEEKQLLLKDLCARLPYGVKVMHSNTRIPKEILNIDSNGIITVIRKIEYNGGDIVFNPCGVETIKPYLRPMSSMTDEENAILNNISNKDRGYEEDEDGWVRCDSIHTKWGVWPDGCAKLLDYLNSIHVDYRGLIPMGLALEAPEGMYKTE